MMTRGFQYLQKVLGQGTRLASSRLWVALFALAPMACLVTDRIEFRLVPPNVSASTPAIISRLPGAPDVCNEEGRYREFRADVSSQLVDRPLQARVLFNGAVADSPDVPPTGEVVRTQIRFCLGQAATPPVDDGAPDDFARLNSGFSRACNKVELVVSSALKPFKPERPAEPVTPGDVDRVVWWVVNEAREDSPGQAFQSCAEQAAEALLPDGGLQ